VLLLKFDRAFKTVKADTTYISELNTSYVKVELAQSRE